MQIRNTSRIITTPEEIVRQHRVEMLRRIDPEDVKKRLEGGNLESKESSQPDLRIIYLRSPLRIKRIPWHRMIRWGVAFECLCWGVAIACFIYLGIFVFGPFTVKLIWR